MATRKKTTTRRPASLTQIAKRLETAGKSIITAARDVKAHAKKKSTAAPKKKAAPKRKTTTAAKRRTTTAAKRTNKRPFRVIRRAA